MPIWVENQAKKKGGKEHCSLNSFSRSKTNWVESTGLDLSFLLPFLVGGNVVSSQALKWKNQRRCENLMRHATLPARRRVACGYSPFF